MQMILHYDETYREVKYSNMGLQDIDSKMLMGINVTPIVALLYTPILIRYPSCPPAASPPCITRPIPAPKLPILASHCHLGARQQIAPPGREAPDPILHTGL